MAGKPFRGTKAARDALARGATVPSGPTATPVVRAAAECYGVRLEQVAGTGAGGRITKDDVLTAAGLPTSQDEALYAKAWGTANASTAQAAPAAERADVADEAYQRAWGPAPELDPITDPAYLAAWGDRNAQDEFDPTYAAVWGDDTTQETRP